MRPSLSFAEEYQNLRSADAFQKEHVKADIHQSAVEIGTGICNHVQKARRAF